MWPTNKTLLISAEASDVDGQVTRVEFYALDNSTRPMTTNRIGESLTQPFALTVTLPQSTVSLFAVATDDAGLTSTSAPVRVGFQAQMGGEIGYSPLDPKNPITGHFEREIEYENNSTFVLEGIRLTLLDVPPALRIVNATGTSGNSAYLDYIGKLPPGAGVTLVIEIAWSNPSGFLDTEFRFEPIPVQPDPAPSGQMIAVDGISLTSGDNPLLQWGTLAGATYAVQYTDDLVQWKTSLPFVGGTGNSLLWIDNGPPRTDQRAATRPLRLYRVLRLGQERGMHKPVYSFRRP